MDQAMVLFKAWREEGNIQAYRQLLEQGFDVIDQAREQAEWEETIKAEVKRKEVDPDFDWSEHV